LSTPLLKGVFDREPPEAQRPSIDWSFPSGHAAGSMALAAVAIALTQSPRWRRLLLLPTALVVVAIGVAAVIAGGHWPSDVIAGWALALAWVSALCSRARSARPRQSPKTQRELRMFEGGAPASKPVRRRPYRRRASRPADGSRDRSD
jgi:membrane-associated phospholipid phosphatase